jgi:hypothetical protein
MTHAVIKIQMKLCEWIYTSAPHPPIGGEMTDSINRGRMSRMSSNRAWVALNLKG